MLDARWSGERWRLWSFVAGLVSIPLALLLAAIVGLVTGERVVPLVLLFLVIAILTASLVGSGIIDTLSTQLNRGGLARESTDDINRALEAGDVKSAQEESELRRDIRTMRAGLFVIAPIVAFVYFMTIV